MAGSMLGALVRAGLVPEEKARHIRAEEARKVEYEQRIQLYPKNRLGKPLVWAEWFLREQIPEDVRHRCCDCGLAMAPADLQLFRPGVGPSRDFFQDVTTVRCRTCTAHHQGKRDRGTPKAEQHSDRDVRRSGVAGADGSPPGVPREAP